MAAKQGGEEAGGESGLGARHKARVWAEAELKFATQKKFPPASFYIHLLIYLTEKQRELQLA